MSNVYSAREERKKEKEDKKIIKENKIEILMEKNKELREKLKNIPEFPKEQKEIIIKALYNRLDFLFQFMELLNDDNIDLDLKFKKRDK